MTENETIESRPELEAFIRRRVRAANGITFAEYMAHCLYHPEYGYYMSPRERIGKQGDFFTSTSVHALFGGLIARQLVQMWELLGRGEFTIAEQGAGEGHLCLDILNALAAEAPEFYNRLRYRLVEIGGPSRQRQRRLLAAHRDRIDWCDLADLADMEGCFLSNELIDAMPVHLVEKRAGALQEVYVVERNGRLTEELRAPSSPLIADHFARLGTGPVEGNRGEVNLEAVRWMRQVGTLLKRGFVLTIDYGYPAGELYAPFRRNGTLMCYHRHATSEDPYQRFGLQDITAHIDFTSLQQAGEQAGLQTLYFGEQYQFLMGLGFIEGLMELQARESDEKKAQALRMTLKNLILPDGGMGGLFKVLVQGRGVDEPRLLCSRSIAEISLPPV